ncbi:MAG TPA: hypothetical protein PK028_06375 [Bacteroidales bacterium]|jgi:carbon monoxide dehydrogenase subunit G|nr:hypothetical protein [Bacteroidales bacterium]MDI9573525.1 hypothetical protein [Bacteroidota bacterium]MBP9511970.1 hypothetical protein [Bacteroidales bacterium]MBP9588573.1 hypothetical protein [Bacteroidales bacterium]HNQ60216.1 hypothetical protein [Bacteroidales bacterium]
MMNLKSNTIEVRHCPEDLFAYLTDLNRLQQALPPQVINYHVEGDACSFTIEGMTDISLLISMKIPYTRVVYSNAVDKPFSFSLVFDISPAAENKSMVSVAFEARANSFLSGILKKPMQNFVDLVSQKLNEL